MTLPDPADFQVVRAGTLPWNLAGLTDALSHLNRLVTTPNDDWDRRPRRFSVLDDETGFVQGYSINPDTIDTQITYYILERYTEDGPTAVASHFFRLMEVRRFLHVHNERLFEEQWLKPAEEEDQALMSEALLEALAVSQYEAEEERPYGDGSTGTEMTFDYDKVIARAQEIADRTGQ